jgi:hypothetical protein
VDDIFSNLKLDHAHIRIPTLSKEDKGIIETILQGRSILGPGGLVVMETLGKLRKLLTFPSDVEGMTNPSFQCHLAIIG